MRRILLVLLSAASVPLFAAPLATQIVAGEFHTCMLTPAGAVKCWGLNDDGQVGEGGTAANRLQPADVKGLTRGVVQIGAGAYHTCALLEDRSVRCWGFNGNGRLGDGTTTNRSLPTPVPGLGRVRSLFVGQRHTCVALEAGPVQCWGANEYGQLGDGTKVDRLSPTDIPALGGDTRKVVGGFDYGCALKDGGAVLCWGHNDHGQLGDGSPESAERLTPAPASLLSASDLVGGPDSICAIGPSNLLWCWGLVGYQQTAQTYVDVWRTTPGLQAGATDVAKVVLGDTHACIVTTAGRARCWRFNGWGSVGDGTRDLRPAPVDVLGLTGAVVAMGAGGAHNCVATDAGAMKCWGANDQGQLGDGAQYRDSPLARDVAFPAWTYQGLWFNPAEAGWGINFSHQGDVLFGTWFTYGADGKGTWYVMSEGRKTAAGRYAGTLYATTGVAFNSAPWPANAVTVRPVGTLAVEFGDNHNGTMVATVDGTTVTKAITRQVYSLATPECIVAGSFGANPNYQELWWASPPGSESGWGVNVTHQGDILFATWFTYDATGKPQWLVMSEGARNASGAYTGTLYRTTGPAFSASPWDPSQVHVTPAGTATFTFNGLYNGTFVYTLDGVTQSKPITRQYFASPPTVCR